jgi:hypothetical protein
MQQPIVGMPMENMASGRAPISQAYIPMPLDRGWSDGDMGQGGLNLQDAQNVDGRILSEAEIGDLADLWNWESLDLGFVTNPIM